MLQEVPDLGGVAAAPEGPLGGLQASVGCPPAVANLAPPAVNQIRKLLPWPDARIDGPLLRIFSMKATAARTVVVRTHCVTSLILLFGREGCRVY